ncbi:MAG: PASTA domain-containing protein [Actinomycetota bacterium]
MGAPRPSNRLVAALVLLALLGSACNEGTEPRIQEQTEESDEVVVPALSGRDVKEARNLLEAAGFRVEVEQQVFPNAEPGTVVDSEPSEGTLVEAGSTVTITIATRR